jgi:hypothetical protein
MGFHLALGVGAAEGHDRDGVAREDGGAACEKRECHQD